MMKKDSNPVAKVYIPVLLVMVLFLVPSCKKSPVKSAPSQTQQQSADNVKKRPIKVHHSRPVATH